MVDQGIGAVLGYSTVNTNKVGSDYRPGLMSQGSLLRQIIIWRFLLAMFFSLTGIFSSESAHAINPATDTFYCAYPGVYSSTLGEFSDALLTRTNISAATVGRYYVYDGDWITCAPGRCPGVNANCYYSNGSYIFGDYYVRHVIQQPDDGGVWQGRQFTAIFVNRGNPNSFDFSASPLPDKNPPELCPSAGNPIKPATGNKIQTEYDYIDPTNNALSFIRYYNLQLKGGARVGVNWLTNQHPQILRTPTATKFTSLRPNGLKIPHSFNGPFAADITSWPSVTDPDINDKLTQYSNATFQLKLAANDSVETYDNDGFIFSSTTREGLTVRYTYASSNNANYPSTAPACNISNTYSNFGMLKCVTDNFGHQLNFTYNISGQIATMTDPAGNVFSYAYDNSGNLKTVTYPDDTSAVLTDNPKKTYVYGSDPGETVNTGGVSQPNALTGLIDENGVRYATYKYDANGKAISTEHADTGSGPVEKYSLNYAPDGSSTSVIDPLCQANPNPDLCKRTTRFTTVLGVVKSTGTDQPGGSGCSAAASAMTYDVNGNVASRTGFSNPGYDGHKTCYAYDMSRNLETARVEGLASVADCATALSASSLAAPARKITTSWHPTYRLPLKVAEPKLLTTYTRDAQGNVLTKTEQATTDLSGVAGLTPTIAPNTLARTWAYTYNALGQVLTANGPRTDVPDITTYTYYPDTDPVLGNRGNIKDITNPLGQKTIFNGYDGNGRLTQMTAPNGVVTTMAYTPRGWLKTLTVKDSANALVQTTSYGYDPTGLLKTVTAPDGSVLTYGYDPAHRLTSVTDSLGNKVSYTLDAIGNRIAEKATDPTNVLRRNITRVYDALNRLQTVTGGVQ
jgi:YD repeat-containing protein